MEQSNPILYWPELKLKEYNCNHGNGQQKEQQDIKEEEPIKDGLNLDAVECRITDFPRLRYHNKLMKGLGDRFEKLFQRNAPLVNVTDFVHWKHTNENPTIYLAGQDLGRKYSLISKYNCHQVNMATRDRQHSSTTFSMFKDHSPSCVLFSCDEKETKYETIMSIKKLSEDVTNSDLTTVGPCVIVVMTQEECPLSLEDFIGVGISGNYVQIVTLSGDTDLLEYLTSAFEVAMVEYIKVLQLTLMSLERLSSVHKLSSLKTESEAILNRLQLASKLPKMKKEISVSMSIPAEVQHVLDSNSDKLYGYGFRQKEFYILINGDLSDKQTLDLRADILKSKEMAKFSWNITFEESKGVSVVKYFGPGSRIVPNQNKPHRYGTLGGFAQINSSDVVGITNFHVIGRDVVAYVKDNDKFVELGQSFLVLSPGPNSLADFSLIKVDNSMVDRCRRPLVDDDDEPKSATIYQGTPDHIIPGIVHKKGAATGITQGMVVEVMYYRDILGDRETRSAFLVEDLEMPFSDHGDSGSIVFRNSLSATQSEIEVIAILNGRYKKHGEDEESPYIVCSNMKFVHEKLQRDGKYLQFFKKEGPI